ncbi:extracellular solute-binding protein [Paenibacillus sp. WQ 127069]|uniref:Extracellular solute-binding protein n=1 Tax=Paenibacillus baimaensis TaxID=2982185 RepID=A0ABT2UEW9_9BACL|nr:extracellular solute-binding protein [Paenibacillus sp. WQ 127069]MCU6793189.1 extracellular solute-binding protein [Paenibacillus sp. WQ 127069]
MRKRKAALLVSISLVFVSACSSAPDPNSANNPAQANGGKTKIVVYHWTPVEGMESAVKVFNETHPDIEAVYVKIPDSPDVPLKVNTLLASGEQIDVIAQWSPDDLRTRVDNDLYEPLNSYFEENKIDFAKTFGEEVAKLETINGNIYGVPYGNKVNGIFYNKKLFDEAKVPYPKDDWTWEDFRETAKKLTKGEGPNKQYGFLPYVIEDWATIAQLKLGLNAMYKNDKESNYDNPYFKESLQLFHNMQFTDKSIMPLAEFPAKKLDSATNRANVFFKGQAGMYMGASFITFYSKFPENKHDFDIGVVNMPRYDKDYKTTSTISYSDLSIPKSSKQKKAAFEWVKFFTIDRPDVTSAPKGMQPPAPIHDENVKKGVFDTLYNVPTFNGDQVYKVFNDPSTVLVSDQTTITVAKKEIGAVVKEEVTRVFLGEKSVDDAVKDMKKRSDELIAKAKK